RRRREGAELVEGVERGVEVLGEEQQDEGHAEGAGERHPEQPQTLGSRRLGGGHGGLEDPELLALLALLHALSELGLLVPAGPGFVELLPGGVCPRKLPWVL